MENNAFRIQFDDQNGGISSLVLLGDPAGMNFCREGRALFALRHFNLASFEQSDSSAVSISHCMGVKAVKRTIVNNLCKDMVYTFCVTLLCIWKLNGA